MEVGGSDPILLVHASQWPVGEEHGPGVVLGGLKGRGGELVELHLEDHLVHAAPPLLTDQSAHGRLGSLGLYHGGREELLALKMRNPPMRKTRQIPQAHEEALR